MKLFKLFFWGLFISLTGSLPLGTLNVATFKISVSAGHTVAFWFTFGCVFIEVLYVRLSLTAMNWVLRNGKFLKIMTYLLLFITLSLALASFVAAFKNNSTNSTFPFIIKSSWSALFLGIGLSSINPAQIPFWFGFSAILQSKKILLPLHRHYTVYMLAIACGSFMAGFIFIYTGDFMTQGIGKNNFIINSIVGFCFTIAAVIQLVRIFNKKGNALTKPAQLWME